MGSIWLALPIGMLKEVFIFLLTLIGIHLIYNAV